ncbi:MAG: uroporphyrinogen-III C-methyltransferase [Chromatiales bacterium]|nr:uroporphyrinogen-III C-methyltransferase [Chromatiales bacterium]
MSQEQQDKEPVIEQPDEGTGESVPPEPDIQESAAEVVPDQQSTPEPRPAPKARGGRGLAFLALFISLLAVAASAWLWRDAQLAKTSLAQRGASETSRRGDLEQSMTALRREVDRLEAGRAALESSRQDSFDDIARLSQRLGNLEAQMTSMQGVSDETRKRWIMSEVEYYLQIANVRLQLAGDVKTTISALRLADGRLSAMDDPALLEVRRVIRGELTDLGAVDVPDIQGIALTLSSLGTRISQLPLSRSVGDETDDSTAQAAEGEDGWDRAVSKVGAAFKDIVSVRKTDEQITPLLSVSEEFFLRRNLELKLEAARLALLNGDETSFRESLRSARGWLGQYFDTSNSATSSAIETLAGLEMQSIQPALPDISGSLNLLRTLPVNSGN